MKQNSEHQNIYRFATFIKSNDFDRLEIKIINRLRFYNESLGATIVDIKLTVAPTKPRDYIVTIIYDMPRDKPILSDIVDWERYDIE